MQLQPRRQPGRTDRKAAAYASEIVQLRTDGYTYEAIREALSDVGIALSTSALRREVRRRQQETARSGPEPRTALRTSAIELPSPSLPRGRAPPAVASSREIAEAFFITHPSNPLLRHKDRP
jgi:hypothetical protein